MHRIPQFLMFCTGVFASAFTNLATGLNPDSQLAWRLAAMLVWLVASGLLFWAALKSETALAESHGVPAKFRHEFRGMRGLIQTIFSWLLAFVATFLMFWPVFAPNKPDTHGTQAQATKGAKAHPPETREQDIQSTVSNGIVH